MLLIFLKLYDFVNFSLSFDFLSFLLIIIFIFSLFFLELMINEPTINKTF